MAMFLQFGSVIAAFLIVGTVARICKGGCLVSIVIGLLGAVATSRVIFVLGIGGG